jgi:hypothetical protein
MISKILRSNFYDSYLFCKFEELIDNLIDENQIELKNNIEKFFFFKADYFYSYLNFILTYLLFDYTNTFFMEKLFSLLNEIINFDEIVKNNVIVILKDYINYYNEIVIAKKFLIIIYNLSKGKNNTFDMSRYLNIIKFFDFLHLFVCNKSYLEVIQLNEEFFLTDFRYTRELCNKIKKIKIKY